MKNGRMLCMEEKKTLVLKEKMFLTDTLAKMSQNIFAYFPFQNILHLFIFVRKKPILITARGFAPPPPPFTDWFVTIVIFYASPYLGDHMGP